MPMIPVKALFARSDLQLRATPHDERSSVDAGKIGYNALSLVCLSITISCAALRLSQYYKARLFNLTRLITALTYVVVVMCLACISMLSNGIGLVDPSVCHAAIYVCLAFYGLSKFLMYMFVAERAHAVRSVELNRRQDKLWIATVIIIILGCVGVIGFAMARAQSSLHLNGSCHIGVPASGTGPILAFDMTANIWLCGLFVWLLRPTLKQHAEVQGVVGMSSFARRLIGNNHDKTRQPSMAMEFLSTPFEPASKAPDDAQQPRLHVQDLETYTPRPPSRDVADMFAPSPIRTDKPQAHFEMTKTISEDTLDFVQMLHEDGSGTTGHRDRLPSMPIEAGKTIIQKLDALVKRNLIGTVILFAPILINGGIFWIFKGFEPGGMCFTICSLDITCSICVMHWLTSTSDHVS